MSTYQLIVGNLRTTFVEHEPPDISKDGSNTNISTNDHVSEKQPTINQAFLAVTGRSTHDIMIGRVEAKSSSR
jgi:hypothetical protein